MNSQVKILRETEFYQGFIRLKMSVTNETASVITDVDLDFRYDENTLHIDRHEPFSYQTKNGKIFLGNLDPWKSKSISVYFDPLICSKGTGINCQVTYKDSSGSFSSFFMEPKNVSVVCPILQTDSDINIGHLKTFLEILPNRDSKVYEIQSNFDINKFTSIAREVIEKYDVRHIRTLHTKDGRECEIWYYGKTKVQQETLVIKLSFRSKTQSLELFAATERAEALTGFLADVGRDLKQNLKSRAGGSSKIINLSIKDSVIQRSNLLDHCDMSGECSSDIVVEKSYREEKYPKVLDEPNSLPPTSNGQLRCPVCNNLIDSSNRSLLCGKCGAQFCQICEGWFREERKRGERPLCEKCFTEQERLKKEEEERIRREKEEKERIRKEKEERIRKEKEEQDRLKRQKEEEERRKLSNSVGMEFVKIPSGEFMMGSNEYNGEQPVHKVTIRTSFFLGKYPVTQKQWVKVMGSNPSYFKGDDLPVEKVSWDDAQKFIQKLNQMEGTDEYRLPSEAEWEYACRAGTTTRYYFGDDELKLGNYAWYSSNSGDETHPVGQKKPNAWGLYDMHGNVWEWCQDRWHDNYSGAPSDGSAWEDGSVSDRVIRGGSWSSHASLCRSASRNRNGPGDRAYSLGFRVLRKL